MQNVAADIRTIVARGFASTIVPGEAKEFEPEVVWAKFKSLVAGARQASKELWS